MMKLIAEAIPPPTSVVIEPEDRPKGDDTEDSEEDQWKCQDGGKGETGDRDRQAIVLTGLPECGNDTLDVDALTKLPGVPDQGQYQQGQNRQTENHQLAPQPARVLRLH